MLTRIRLGLSMLDLRKVKARIGECPLCGRTIFIKLNDNEWAVRCLVCGAAPNSIAIGVALKHLAEDLQKKKVYILSFGGPLFSFLRKNAGQLVYSQFFNDVPRGKYKGNVQCQDVQQLTYDDKSFDVCICTEVFEHVPDDAKGFAEIFRVLKPRGTFLFTVPLRNSHQTIERATIHNGTIKYILDREYHNDPVAGRILCFRNYGKDIVNRLLKAGFENCRIIPATDIIGMGYGRPVVVASKAPLCRYGKGNDSHPQ